MLQIKNIRKQYVTGELVQTALNDVSLSFREHELVAILGPSGSGKSTLLNVIGGLDHYDSGDLIIDGISTKKYKDRDWDSYRNHSVGFIFQSYNLIPHQNVLSNVELALTISGIPASERKRRAVEALKKVGLENQIHKRPNQMSGGQMQRVAIARALVNNPKILLADEPTGALDSETSIQVMELLKEVARDRLVIMVTHNPELAEQYATRIVRVKDGNILDDTNPYTPDLSAQEPPQHKNMGKASMGFGSALALSFQNLWTKKTRTLLTSFAGSIGIIGIALILSLSSGFQAYVDSIQRDTLANYPLSFQAETADMSAAFMSMMMPEENAGEEVPGTVQESPMLARMLAHIGVNDLASFKKHIEENQETVDTMVNSIEYGYGIRPKIYTTAQGEEPFQVNPASLFKKITGNDGISAIMDVDAFQQLTDDRDMLNEQYDILKGRWPEKYDELVFVLPMGGRIADQTAYTLGLKSMDHMNHMLELMEQGLSPITDEEPMQWSYDDLMNLKFRWVPTPEFYRYNKEFNVWEDLSDDPAFLKEAVGKGLELHVVGIAAPKEGSSPILMPGLAYPSSFTEHVIENAAQSEIVKQQLSNRDVDVFSGAPFNSEELQAPPDFSSMISIDKNAIASSFGISVSESDFAALLEQCLTEIRNTIQVNTVPAQAEFVSTLSDFGTRMLSDAVASGGGSVKISLADADSMVRSFLSSDYAAQRMDALGKKYSLPADTFYSVYHPLLIGLISEFIAQEISSIPAPALSYEAPVSPAFQSLNSHSDGPVLNLLTDITLEPAAESGSASNVEEAPSQIAPEESQADDFQNQGNDNSSQTPDAGSSSAEQSNSTAEVPEQPDSQEPAPDNSGTEEGIPETEEPETTFPEGTDETQPGETDSGESEPEETVPDETENPNLPIRPDSFSGILTADKIAPLVSSYCSSSMVSETSRIIGKKMMEASVMQALAAKLTGLQDVFTQFLRKSFFVDTNRLAGAFRFNMDEEKIQRLFEALTNGNQARSADSNLRKLGYADLDSPSTMNVYMKDFDGKEAFIQFLEDYNQSMRNADQEEKVIRYTDMTGQMMDSVRVIINSVSYVLIAFVAVSLVVSSIMIGIITYISVMERTKEIGVLRAMGASKHNISQVFNAETFIIGLCSGILGIAITLVLLIPGNRLLLMLTKNAQITAQLPLAGAVILIILSMVLTLLGGLIPSRQAAKKDPVIALRSE